MLLFQVPRLPEAGLRANQFAALRRSFRIDPVRRDALSEADIARYVEAAQQSGVLTGGINYYRTLFRQGVGRTRASIRRIEAPVLVIWGAMHLVRHSGCAVWVGAQHVVHYLPRCILHPSASPHHERQPLRFECARFPGTGYQKRLQLLMRRLRQRLHHAPVARVRVILARYVRYFQSGPP